MPNLIEISASSMTSLLGAVEASKTAHSQSRKSTTKSGDAQNDVYDLSRYKKGSFISKNSSSHKSFNERLSTVSNKGVKSRALKDKLAHESIRMSNKPPSVQEQLAMDALQRKSKIYEATILGKKGGLSDKQLESCPLDVDAKRANLEIENDLEASASDLNSEVESDDQRPRARKMPASSSSYSMPFKAFTGRLSSIQDSSTTAMLGEKQPEEEDWIERKDEFGRDILVPAAQIKLPNLDPQRTMAFTETDSARHLKEIGAQYGPQTSFPVLESSDRPIKKTDDEPIEKYFDPKAERRQLGTAFYSLSSNPEERQRQLEELRSREAETMQARNALSDQPDKQLSVAQTALEARKRQLQLKKEELARKRMKNADTSSTKPSVDS